MNNNSELNVISKILNKKIGFIGVGKMGGALLLSYYNFLKNYDLFYLCEGNLNLIKYYQTLGFINISSKEKEVFERAKIIFLCVKPDLVQGILERNREYITNETLIISIAAGINLEFIEKSLKIEAKIIRLMTNHLCLINEGGSVFTMNKNCSTEEEAIIKYLLKGNGLLKQVPEKQINIFTALSGSGPAFVYYFADALADAALTNGLDIDTATEYGIHVIFAAGKYMNEMHKKNIKPINIKYDVTTPSGTTIAGLNQLDKYKLKFAINQAITKATKRAEEIEKEKMSIFSKPKF